MKLLKPNIADIPKYIVALRRGWSHDNLRPEAAQEEIESKEKDITSFISTARYHTRMPVILAPESYVTRLTDSQRTS